MSEVARLESAGSELAVSDKRAASLARISLRQVRYWDETGLVVPSIKRRISQRNTVRLYSFQDLLSLLVAAQLRNRISLQHIRRIVTQLSKRGFVEPLQELIFATYGDHVFFQYPDGSWSGDPLPDQVIFHQVVELEALRAKISTVAERDAGSAGRLVRRRGVMGNKPIFAGTRIPVETVRRYLDAGCDTSEILAEYPSLTAEDVEAARNFAEGHHCWTASDAGLATEGHDDNLGVCRFASCGLGYLRSRIQSPTTEVSDRTSHLVTMQRA